MQAKERLWMMNFFRHLGQGRVSEILGPAGVEIDFHIRTVGVNRASRAYVENITPEEGAIL